MELPHNTARWTRDVASHYLGEESLFTLETPKSASKISLPQFLMLRVLYQPVKVPQYLHDLFIGKAQPQAVTVDSWTRAVKYLNNSQSFQEYLDAIGHRRSAGGVFSMARLYQIRCSTLLRQDEDVDSSGKIGVSRRLTRSQTRQRDQAQQSPSRKPTGLGAVEGLMESLSVNDPKTPGQSSSSGALPPPADITYVTPLSGAGDSDFLSKATDKAYQYIEDEQIVNFALSLLLDSLVERCNDAHRLLEPVQVPVCGPG